jgi:NitT/TauT family transport system substrate-binding protein
MAKISLWIASMLIATLTTGIGIATAADSSGAKREPVRIGYLHSIQSDAHMWLGLIDGEFNKAGLDVVQTTQFNTGVSLAQALAGGSIDVASMGAVISNFPARGQGEAFLANNIEAKGAQIWVAGGSGINKVADLKGKKIATTVGTTGHVILYVALKNAGLSMDDVQLVNADMPTAVNAFISGSVPALATWVPYDTQIHEQSPNAKVLASAADYFPQSAILGGWVASNEAYANRKDMLSKFASAWLKINRTLHEDPKQSIAKIQSKAYPNFTPERVQEMFDQQRWYTNAEWAEQYKSGKVGDWLGKVEKVFVDLGGLPSYVPPEKYFDPSIFLKAYQSEEGRQ